MRYIFSHAALRPLLVAAAGLDTFDTHNHSSNAAMGPGALQSHWNFEKTGPAHCLARFACTGCLNAQDDKALQQTWTGNIYEVLPIACPMQDLFCLVLGSVVRFKHFCGSQACQSMAKTLHSLQSLLVRDEERETKHLQHLGGTGFFQLFILIVLDTSEECCGQLCTTLA